MVSCGQGLIWLYEAKWLRIQNPQFCPQPRACIDADLLPVSLVEGTPKWAPTYPPNSTGSPAVKDASRPTPQGVDGRRSGASIGGGRRSLLLEPSERPFHFERRIRSYDY